MSLIQNEYSILISTAFCEFDLFYKNLPEYQDVFNDSLENYNSTIKSKTLAINTKIHLINAISKRVEKIKIYLVNKQKSISNIEKRLEKYIDDNHYKRDAYFLALNTFKTTINNFEMQVNSLLLDCEVNIDRLENEIFNNRDLKL